MGMLEKLACLVRQLPGQNIPLYAANACFFLVLSGFPALLLLLGLLRYTPLKAEQLMHLLEGFLPEAFLAGARALVRTAWDHTSGTAVGISAVAALWSASRGTYGIVTGLNQVYGLREDRGWLRIRLLSAVYTFAFLLAAPLTLAMHIFASELLGALEDAIVLRYVLLLFLQTGVFTAMFQTLPNRKSSFRQALPGALLASAGWMAFSKGYSVYALHFAVLSNVYGSVYALALGMLWLYCCMCIVLWGGSVNAFLLKEKR